MTGVIESRLVKKVSWIDYLGALSANSGGYGRFTIPDDKYALISGARVILSTSIGLAHPGTSGGLVLTGMYESGNSIYVSYYTFKAISQSTSDVVISIAYI